MPVDIQLHAELVLVDVQLHVELVLVGVQCLPSASLLVVCHSLQMMKKMMILTQIQMMTHCVEKTWL